MSKKIKVGVKAYPFAKYIYLSVNDTIVENLCYDEEAFPKYKDKTFTAEDIDNFTKWIEGSAKLQEL